MGLFDRLFGYTVGYQKCTRDSDALREYEALEAKLRAMAEAMNAKKEQGGSVEADTPEY